ncbi:MAG: helix-turn-helix domain-containing protein [Gemmataceae bacterium]
MFTFTRWVSMPENEGARSAVAQLAEHVAGQRVKRAINPLFLHGPPGSGKTHLISALTVELTHRYADRVIELKAANEIASLIYPEGPVLPSTSDSNGRNALIQCDLLIIEDLQHLASSLAVPLANIIDDRLARRRQTVFTATVGPAHLSELGTRLTSRLAGGLVVGLAPLTAPSRLTLLETLARRKRFPLSQEVLLWLAEHLNGSVRQLEGALARLETLSRLQSRPLSSARVAEFFRTEADAGRPTVERITQRVGRYFQLKPEQLQSRRRLRNALLPRQVSMYLARQLTPLSLNEIGAFFGGRDHSTVLHACRKVQNALSKDANLSGAICQLNADLA